MTVKSILYQSRLRGIEDAVEQWKVGHNGTIELGDLEAVLLECEHALQFLSSWHQEAWAKLWDGTLPNVHETGVQLEAALRQLPPVLEAARDGVSTKANGSHVNHSGRLDALLKGSRELLRELEEKWPKFDVKQLEQAAAGGDAQPAEDVFRDLLQDSVRHAG